ncbi:hypothetical protein DNTS_025867 [Danionella cerebrum]|uniref:BZIP domain-containing protein n=1 Tax=Danionella cerebrum TaxID=2873325 RepID=A0A553NAA3_9TELE|nr:hypothetical protein DNTS_025867 [Danionella translucida]
MSWEAEREAEELSLRALGLRRKREFIPEDKKDAMYWEKRRKNNEAAKRSREKRRVSDYMMETHLLSLSEENARLRAELLALKLHHGLINPGTSYKLSQKAPFQFHGFAHQHFASIRDKDLPSGEEKTVTNLSRKPPQQICLGSHPRSAFLPTNPLAIQRFHPYFLDVPNIHSPTAATLHFASHHNQGTAKWADYPLLQSESQRIFSDEEREQQVPADYSKALPHKMRLKTQNLQEQK